MLVLVRRLVLANNMRKDSPIPVLDREPLDNKTQKFSYNPPINRN